MRSPWKHLHRSIMIRYNVSDVRHYYSAYKFGPVLFAARQYYYYYYLLLLFLQGQQHVFWTQLVTCTALGSNGKTSTLIWRLRIRIFLRHRSGCKIPVNTAPYSAHKRQTHNKKPQCFAQCWPLLQNRGSVKCRRPQILCLLYRVNIMM